MPRGRRWGLCRGDQAVVDGKAGPGSGDVDSFTVANHTFENQARQEVEQLPLDHPLQGPRALNRS